jgi:PIN domain nuclease of toxin-antitoxin system
MRLLLDTHVLIWWDAGERLSAAATRAIREADEVLVSGASAWELAIKASLGKVIAQRPLADAIADSGFTELPVLVRHAESLASLPPLHRDPFDRLLVAQAITERLTLVTRDEQVRQYAVRTLKA